MEIEPKVDLEHGVPQRVKQRLKDRINERMTERIKCFQNKNKALNIQSNNFKKTTTQENSITLQNI